MGGTPTISLVVPTLNAGREIFALLSSLITQDVAPGEVLVVDSSSDDGTVTTARSLGAHVLTIPRAEFDHGGTRHRALLRTHGDIVCFMTQDALPADAHTIANLVRPLIDDPSVAASYARQLPKPGARRYTELVQTANYPAEPQVRSAADVGRQGVRALYLSDVCSAYRRSDYLALGGFARPLSTNEDMLFAARALHAGRRVAYAADALVYHSHDLTPAEQFRRNRAVGRFLSSHAGELGVPDETGEGARLFWSVSAELVRERRPLELAGFCADCAARLVGNRVGRAEGGA